MTSVPLAMQRKQEGDGGKEADSDALKEGLEQEVV